MVFGMARGLRVEKGDDRSRHPARRRGLSPLQLVLQRVLVVDDSGFGAQ